MLSNQVAANNNVIKKFEPFVLGFCKCGCGTEIGIRCGHYLKRYSNGHNLRGERNPNWKKNMSGPNNPSWKGGRYVSKESGYAYVYTPNHPFRGKRQYIREHRLVYERFLTELNNGIPTYIHPSIEIDHKDKNKLNNKIGNLRLFSKSDHSRLHGIERGGLNGAHS